MSRRLKGLPASACAVGAAAMIGLDLYYVSHGSKGDPPDLAKVVLAGGLSTSQSAVMNLILPVEKALEPGLIRAEAPSSRLFPGTPLVLGKFDI